MGLIFDIKRFSINDGPGIRTTVFLKGCPLHCVWCHNPEGISPAQQILFTAKKCIHCGTCAGEGVDACPTLARVRCGREWPFDELMQLIEKERAVMERSGGGVTLCGGEPLMQADYALSLLRACGSRGFHRAVDTTLFAPWQTVARIADECELLLVDLKTMSSTDHLRYCGVPNEPILANIRRVAEARKPFWIRIPLIEGINADRLHLAQAADFLSSLPFPPEQVNLLPYHDIGKGKHEKLGTTYNPEHLPMRTPSDEVQQACLRMLADAGLKAVIGG